MQKRKSDKNILIAFILNLLFSILEFFGGLATNSVAIMSDSVHSLGDALSTGISYILEHLSHKRATPRYTYGYTRYSLLGGVITTLILFIGSTLLTIEAIERIIDPAEVSYDGMIIFAILGAVLNFLAALATHGGESLNQKSVNLHMLEDTFSWLAVLVGAIVMKLTGITLIDPILSIGVAIFILFNACKNAKTLLDVFLEKTPKNINLRSLEKQLHKIPGVVGIHHLHIRSVDGYHNQATLHIVVERYNAKIKSAAKDILKSYQIDHSTIELELKSEVCSDQTHH